MREEEKGVAAAPALSLHNILLLSQRGFNLFETWSLHSSVLPLALFFTPSLSAYTNTQNKKNAVTSSGLLLLHYCHQLPYRNFQISQIKLSTTRWIFLLWHQCILAFWEPDHDSPWQLSPRYRQSWITDRKMSVGVRGKNYLGWKDVAGQMFTWKASPEIEYLSIFSACGRLIDAGFHAVTWMHATAHILNTEAKPLAIQKQYTRTQRYMKQFMSLTGFNLAH